MFIPYFQDIDSLSCILIRDLFLLSGFEFEHSHFPIHQKNAHFVILDIRSFGCVANAEMSISCFQHIHAILKISKKDGTDVNVCSGRVFFKFELSKKY